ncbi:MAG: crotonobetainyl-CoA:carnitine CoA-transferase CaiB-like acyl-CoA transferase [Candidatus Poriferisodalaceae bacterium]|jgi:crotonobetainyl-CoA:carnitine CoA-transferase CaiB-like acyl-CoA transferase
MRTFGGAFGVTFDDREQEWFYSSLNRNKRSIALDITTDVGCEVFYKMVAEADVFVTNLRESGLVRYGADAESLLAVNPELVYCRGGGFALHGELSEDLCQDTVGMAYAGFMDLTSPVEAPNYPPGSLSDILTGTNMASAVMAGLLKRARTGRGCVVGTSQTQALLWLQLQAVGVAANTDQQFERPDPVGGSNPLFTVYETADGWLAVAVLLPGQWEKLAEAAGIERLLDDPRFVDLEAVMQNRDEFRPLLAEHLRSQTTAHWWSTLRGCGAWVSPVHEIGDLAGDKNILENEYLVTYDDGFVGPPALFEVDGHLGERGQVASYGEHTDKVLTELGYGEKQILDMRIDRAVW